MRVFPYLLSFYKGGRSLKRRRRDARSASSRVVRSTPRAFAGEGTKRAKGRRLGFFQLTPATQAKKGRGRLFSVNFPRPLSFLLPLGGQPLEPTEMCPHQVSDGPGQEGVFLKQPTNPIMNYCCLYLSALNNHYRNAEACRKHVY